MTVNRYSYYIPLSFSFFFFHRREGGYLRIYVSSDIKESLISFPPCYRETPHLPPSSSVAFMHRRRIYTRHQPFFFFFLIILFTAEETTAQIERSCAANGNYIDGGGGEWRRTRLGWNCRASKTRTRHALSPHQLYHRYVNRLTAAFQPDDSCIIVNNRRRAVV